MNVNRGTELNASESAHREHDSRNKETNTRNKGNHVIGVILLFPLLIFHFLCFTVTFSMGIGVGILAAILHKICWDTKFYPFWQTYVMLITIFIVIELFFRVGFDTALTKWMNRVQQRHRAELYYFPRILYAVGYMICVCLLYYAYQGSHSEMPVRFFFTDITFGQNGTQASPEVAPILLQPEKSTFDGEGEVSPLKENPLSLSPNADRFQYSLIFFTSLAYMMYTISKENDWVTHRRTVLEAGLQDPNTTGGVGNFILYLGSHILITLIYGLPLVGSVFLSRQFLMSALLTYATGIFMAVLVGISAVFIERRQPFPTDPMSPPAYAYENHIRIRVIILQLWLLPFAAGRYFDGNRAFSLDAQDDDLLAFTVEVGIGIIQAIKISGNNLFLLKEIYFPSKMTKIEDDYLPSIVDEEESISSVHAGTQFEDHEAQDYSKVNQEQPKPEKEPKAKVVEAQPQPEEKPLPTALNVDDLEPSDTSDIVIVEEDPASDGVSPVSSQVYDIPY